jgi:hypothetical protein
MSAHAPITTLAEWDALDISEVLAGHVDAEKGDPEPGANHTRSYHHGWRTRMMDMGEIPCPPEHHRLIRGVMDRDRIARGQKPRWSKDMKTTI